MICDIICVDGFLYMLHLDIVHMLSAYVHVIHTLSGHMRIMHTLFAVVLDIFLPNRQCQWHLYVISSTLYISYHVQLSFCTLSAQMHIVHVICMFVCTCTHHLLVISNTPCIPYYPQLRFHTLSTHTHCQCHLYIVYRCICYVHLIFTAVICICTCHPHIIWAYLYYTRTTYGGP